MNIARTHTLALTDVRLLSLIKTKQTSFISITLYRYVLKESRLGEIGIELTSCAICIVRLESTALHKNDKHDIPVCTDEASGRGRTVGAVLQGGVRVLRAGSGGGGGRARALGRRRGRQVRARAVPAAAGHAASRTHAHAPSAGLVPAARGAGAGAVGAGGRAAGVAAAAGGRHGGLRRGARGLHGGLPRAALGSRRRRRVRAGRGAVPAGPAAAAAPARAGAAARRAAGAGAAVRRAAGRHGLARAGLPPPRRRRGRAALRALRRHPRRRPLRGARASSAGAGNVDLLPGTAGHCAERTHAAGPLTLSTSQV